MALEHAHDPPARPQVRPLPSGTPPITPVRVGELLPELAPQWHLDAERQVLTRDFKFDNFTRPWRS